MCIRDRNKAQSLSRNQQNDKRSPAKQKKFPEYPPAVSSATPLSDGTEFLDAKSYSIFWDYLTADFWPS